MENDSTTFFKRQLLNFETTFIRNLETKHFIVCFLKLNVLWKLNCVSRILLCRRGKILGKRFKIVLNSLIRYVLEDSFCLPLFTCDLSYGFFLLRKIPCNFAVLSYLPFYLLVSYWLSYLKLKNFTVCLSLFWLK